MKPNTWRIEGQIVGLDLERLQNALLHVSSPDLQVFSKEINSIDWTISNRDNAVDYRGGLSDIDKVISVVGNQEDVVIKLFHKELTGNLRLEKFPEYYLILRFGFRKSTFSIEVSTVGEKNASYIVEKIFEAVTIVPMQLPAHHKYLESYVSKALKDHPEYSKNVFLIIRFREEKPFPEILSTIKNVCAENGLNLLRADDKEYTPDLWDNVMTYMYCCSSAIAIFDEINYREFNPNVSIETGFVFSLGKPILLLKDQAIAAMPSDIVGKIYRPFNSYDVANSIRPQVERWINDYGLSEDIKST